jgi:hypothetical protein
VHLGPKVKGVLKVFVKEGEKKLSDTDMLS